MIKWWLYIKYNRLGSCTWSYTKISQLIKSIEVWFSIKWKNILRPKIAANNSMNFLGRRKGEFPQISRGWYQRWNYRILITSPDHNSCSDGPLRSNFSILGFAKRLPKERHLSHKALLTRTVTSFTANSVVQLVIPLPFEVLFDCVWPELYDANYTVSTRYHQIIRTCRWENQPAVD